MFCDANRTFFRSTASQGQTLNDQTIICRDPDQTSRFCKLIINWCIKREKSVKISHLEKEKIMKL